MNEDKNIAKLETRIERLRVELEDARITGRQIRTARGPWAVTNINANRKLQARLTRQISEAGNELFKARMRAEMAAKELS